MNEQSKAKLWRIAKALRDRTRQGGIEWTETDSRSRFAAVVGDNSFVMDKVDDDVYVVTIQDSKGWGIEAWRVGIPPSSITHARHAGVGSGTDPRASNFTPEGEDESMLTIMRELYERVRRQVWGVDETLDSVLRELDG
jgi:hypothetical protein